MTGDLPVRRPRAIMAFLLGCCGYIVWVSAPARTDDADVKQADLIPQAELIVENEGSVEDLPITYSLRISKEADHIKLKGNMASEKDYMALRGLIRAEFPSVRLTDRIEIKENDADGDVKLGGLSFALKLLGYLEKGSASVDNNGLSLEGSSSTAVVLTEVKTLLEQDKPSGVPLRSIRIAPPTKSWHASVTDDGMIKLSGVVPSEAYQKQIFETVRAKFSQYQIEDNSAVNADLDERWFKASLQSLELLLLLENGSVEVTESAIHLKGSTPSDQAMNSVDMIASDLPSGFALSSEVTMPAPNNGVAAIPMPNSADILRR